MKGDIYLKLIKGCLMSLLNFFKSLSPTGDSNSLNSGTLQALIESNFPEAQEEQLIKFTCLSGLLCRVAFVDLDISPQESSSIINILKKDLDIEVDTAKKITEISIEQTKLLSGIENHRYTEPLCEILDTNARYQILKSLFHVAASDGNADNAECEEIRIITKGLRLDQKHYAAARASVKDYLGSLKS